MDIPNQLNFIQRTLPLGTLAKRINALVPAEANWQSMSLVFVVSMFFYAGAFLAIHYIIVTPLMSAFDQKWFKALTPKK